MVHVFLQNSIRSLPSTGKNSRINKQTIIGKEFVSEEETTQEGCSGLSPDYSILEIVIQAKRNEYDVVESLTKQWQIHKILTGQRYDFWEVCLLCFFLNISINELGEVEKEERESQEIFDDRIAELHNKGYSYPKIAELMGYSVDIIKNAAYSKSKQTKPRKRRDGKPGRRPLEWTRMDEEMLPKVIEMIDNLKNSDKPIRITLGSVARRVGLKSKQIDKLTQCKAENEQH